MISLLCSFIVGPLAAAVAVWVFSANWLLATLLAGACWGLYRLASQSTKP
jgi:hypothetical protein